MRLSKITKANNLGGPQESLPSKNPPDNIMRYRSSPQVFKYSSSILLDSKIFESSSVGSFQGGKSMVIDWSNQKPIAIRISDPENPIKIDSNSDEMWKKPVLHLFWFVKMIECARPQAISRIFSFFCNGNAIGQGRMSCLRISRVFGSRWKPIWQ